MRTREDPRQCRRLASGGKRSLVRSQDEENHPTQIAWRSWHNGQSRMRSDWAALAIDGTVGCDTVIPAGALV